jgi:septal ring factor EnvC (AmiA/AmiB activator)
MTDLQLDERFKVLATLVSAIDASGPISQVAHEVAAVRKEIAEIREQLAKIERDIRTIKARQ